ncbi:MAG: nucleotidyltransferase domain-containing protein [Parachlamydia sp.]|nr:nucleotidyltransferase domain-containing protein [Parachlamydia sp.]
MIHIDQRHLKIIRDILSHYPFHFYAFGSRVKGTNKTFSDLDICSMDDIPELTKFYLKEAFEDSNLPFKVDILEWNKISKDFQNIIKQDLTKF